VKGREHVKEKPCYDEKVSNKTIQFATIRPHFSMWNSTNQERSFFHGRRGNPPRHVDAIVARKK